MAEAIRMRQVEQKTSNWMPTHNFRASFFLYCDKFMNEAVCKRQVDHCLGATASFLIRLGHSARSEELKRTVGWTEDGSDLVGSCQAPCQLEVAGDHQDYAKSVSRKLCAYLEEGAVPQDSVPARMNQCNRRTIALHFLFAEKLFFCHKGLKSILLKMFTETETSFQLAQTLAGWLWTHLQKKVLLSCTWIRRFEVSDVQHLGMKREEFLKQTQLESVPALSYVVSSGKRIYCEEETDKG